MDDPLVYGCVTSSLHIITLIFILDYYAHNFTLLRPFGLWRFSLHRNPLLIYVENLL